MNADMLCRRAASACLSLVGERLERVVMFRAWLFESMLPFEDVSSAHWTIRSIARFYLPLLLLLPELPESSFGIAPARLALWT